MDRAGPEVRLTFFVNQSSKGYFTVALLPNATEATLARFAEYAHHHVIDTRFSSKPVNGQLT
eukprot:SAG31_NODE_42374_length_272_cov_0.589595_1_plen_61_part_10